MWIFEYKRVQSFGGAFFEGGFGDLFMLERDFNKAARRLCWGRTSAWVFSCEFGDTFRGAL